MPFLLVSGDGRGYPAAASRRARSVALSALRRYGGTEPRLGLAFYTVLLLLPFEKFATFFDAIKRFVG